MFFFNVVVGAKTSISPLYRPPLKCNGPTRNVLIISEPNNKPEFRRHTLLDIFKWHDGLQHEHGQIGYATSNSKSSVYWLPTKERVKLKIIPLYIKHHRSGPFKWRSTVEFTTKTKMVLFVGVYLPSDMLFLIYSVVPGVWFLMSGNFTLLPLESDLSYLGLFHYYLLSQTLHIWSCSITTSWVRLFRSGAVPVLPLESYGLWMGMIHYYLMSQTRHIWGCSITTSWVRLFMSGAVPLLPLESDSSYLGMFHYYPWVRLFMSGAVPFLLLLE